MALYAIGDIQGCFDELQILLAKINFDSDRDRLWFTGDLVNRGPKSLETLRFIKSLGNSAVTVLGNHDLHLLALYTKGKNPKKKDTLAPVLNAPDCAELMDWLRYRPLIYVENNFCLVHAGLPPDWNLNFAVENAKLVEKILRGDSVKEFFDEMYGDSPSKWSANLKDWDKIRYITNCLTRMRYCNRAGNLDFKSNCHPADQKRSLIPWFDHPERKNKDVDILFGHWSTLGFYAKNGIYGIDTGCLWGGCLSALRLDGQEIYRISLKCPQNMPVKT